MLVTRFVPNLTLCLFLFSAHRNSCCRCQCSNNVVSSLGQFSTQDTTGHTKSMKIQPPSHKNVTLFQMSCCFVEVLKMHDRELRERPYFQTYLFFIILGCFVEQVHSSSASGGLPSLHLGSHLCWWRRKLTGKTLQASHLRGDRANLFHLTTGPPRGSTGGVPRIN